MCASIKPTSAAPAPPPWTNALATCNNPATDVRSTSPPPPPPLAAPRVLHSKALAVRTPRPPHAPLTVPGTMLLTCAWTWHAAFTLWAKPTARIVGAHGLPLKVEMVPAQIPTRMLCRAAHLQTTRALPFAALSTPPACALPLVGLPLPTLPHRAATSSMPSVACHPI